MFQINFVQKLKFFHVKVLNFHQYPEITLLVQFAKAC